MNEIRMDRGQIDDVVIECDRIHLERMSNGAWWIGVYRADKVEVFWLERKGQQVEVTCTQDDLGLMAAGQEGE